MGSISTTAAHCIEFKIKTLIVFLFFAYYASDSIALTNENAQLAQVDHQTAPQTAESIARTELDWSEVSVSDADSCPGHPDWR